MIVVGIISLNGFNEAGREKLEGGKQGVGSQSVFSPLCVCVRMLKIHIVRFGYCIKHSVVPVHSTFTHRTVPYRTRSKEVEDREIYRFLIPANWNMFVIVVDTWLTRTS